MKWSRQTLLGLAFFAGGSVMLFALVQQINPDDTQVQTLPPAQTILSDQISHEEARVSTDNTLTADIETEQRILAQKQQERMRRVAEQERRTKEFMAEQERAEALALRKARIESERYRDNSAVEPIPETQTLEELATESNNSASNNSSNTAQPSTQSGTANVTKPVITQRSAAPVASRATPSTTQPAQSANLNANNKPPASATRPANTSAQANQATSQAPTRAFDYTVQRGDGLIKLSRRYNVPVQALILANESIDPNSLQVGQTIEIPSRKQVARLLREHGDNADNADDINASSTSQSNVSDNASANPPTGAPPSRPTQYTVVRGDGLIKLARQYNMPVEALAQANNMSTNQNLRVGQRITIPSRAQISRLKREAEEAKRREQALATANQRLSQARRNTNNSEDSGRYGVQVALADNQERANEVASKLRAAGYRVSTSPTNRGVRVIVGPETGKEAALALKDKINADARTDVNGAWVLRWR